MLPKFNNKLLDFHNGEKTSARAFHFMNTEILRSHIVGEWQSIEFEGIHPIIKIDDIRSQMFGKNSFFCNLMKFREKVDDIYINHFTSNRYTYFESKAIISRALICCAMHFFIEYNLEQSEEQQIIQHLIEADIYFNVLTNPRRIRIFGRPTDEQITNISKFLSVKKDFEGKNIFLKLGVIETPMLQIIEEKIYWECISDYLYSGVNLLVKNIEIREKSVANQHVETTFLKCQPTTYLTRMGLGITYLNRKFDNQIIDIHLFLKEYERFYKQFKHEEQQLQNKLFLELTNVQNYNNDEAMLSLNNYLNTTKFFTTISIAGNIKTADDYTILVKRGENLESPNSYSCSVNGVVEAYHEEVELYQFSDINDRPSIMLEQTNFQFEGEFNREMAAELGITQGLTWTMQGITIFQVPRREGLEDVNNLILDVIGKTYTPFTIEQIKIMQNDATESNENEHVFGYKIDIFDNQFERIKNFLGNLIGFLNTHKDVVSFIFVALIFLLQINFAEITSEQILQFINFDWSKEDFSFIFTIILLFVTLAQLKRAIKERKEKLHVAIPKPSVEGNEYVSYIILNKLQKGAYKKANIVLTVLCELEYWGELRKK